MRRAIILACLMAAAAAGTRAAGPLPAEQDTPASQSADLQPTQHAALPAGLDQYWLVPPPAWGSGRSGWKSSARDLAQAIDLVANEKLAQAQRVLRGVNLTGTPLTGYALYEKGVVDLALDQYDAALRTFSDLRRQQPAGYLAEAATLRAAESAEALRDFSGAAALYDDLLTRKPSAPDDILLRLGRAAFNAGDRARAAAAFERIYYEWPTSDAASVAASELQALARAPLVADTPRFAQEIARAERLFAVRRFALAQDAFERLLPLATGDLAELVPLRLAECDYHLGRHQRAKVALQPFLDTASRRAEALFFFLNATRASGDEEEYLRLVRRLVDGFPASSWAEDALNSLASRYIVFNDDERADEVFKELIERFPAGRYTQRAAWKTGWWAYKHGQHADAADAFERAAAVFPRSDFRPSYLYWAGKARDRLGDAAAAEARFALAVTDYGNSYYGRLAAGRLRARKAPVPGGAEAARRFAAETPAAEDTAPVPTADLIRWLITAGMYDAAIDEVRFAERTWGASPVLQATRAWLLNRKGELRPAITLMRQAYPQFLAAGGETLPAEILKVIYPLDFWPLLQKYSALHQLDPYFVSALVAQESTFDPEARSGAGAIGLMQIMPSTGRRWARKLGIRGYSTRKLTVPEVNVRIGTAYLANLVKQFGGEHFALAGYNAGDNRVARWAAERPGVARDAFVDDIPFPETQNYVRRILGTAEDYRRLYGPGGRTAADPAAPRPVIVAPARVRR